MARTVNPKSRPLGEGQRRSEVQVINNLRSAREYRLGSSSTITAEEERRRKKEEEENTYYRGQKVDIQ